MISNMQNNTVLYSDQETKYVYIYKNHIMKKYPLNDTKIMYNVNYVIDDDLMIRIPPLSEVIISDGYKQIKLKNNSANHKSYDKNELHILLEDMTKILLLNISNLEKNLIQQHQSLEYDIEHFNEGQNMYHYVKSNFTLTNIILFITFVLIIYFIILEKYKKKFK